MSHGVDNAVAVFEAAFVRKRLEKVGEEVD